MTGKIKTVVNVIMCHVLFKPYSRLFSWMDYLCENVFTTQIRWGAPCIRWRRWGYLLALRPILAFVEGGWVMSSYYHPSRIRWRRLGWPNVTLCVFLGSLFSPLMLCYSGCVIIWVIDLGIIGVGGAGTGAGGLWVKCHLQLWGFSQGVHCNAY